MSSSSALRVARRQLKRDFKMVCGKCGGEVQPLIAEVLYQGAMFIGRCGCGAVVASFMGQPDFVDGAQRAISSNLWGVDHCTERG